MSFFYEFMKLDLTILCILPVNKYMLKLINYYWNFIVYFNEIEYFLLKFYKRFNIVFFTH